MARGTYILPATNITLANQPVTLLWINPGTDATLEIIRVWCSQAANATSAQQRVQINSQVTAFPSGMTVQEPQRTTALDVISTIVGNASGAAGTCGIDATTEGGTKTVLMPDAFNVLNGWLWVATPEETIMHSASLASGIGVHFPAAPATLTAWNAGLVYAER